MILAVLSACVLGGLSAWGAFGRDCDETFPANGLFIDNDVGEGSGFAGIEFGMSQDQAETVLGAADGGTEGSLRFSRNRLSVCFCGGRATDIHFYPGFRGKLVGSRIGIGDTYEQVEAAYGVIERRRDVESLCSWRLNRTLLVKIGAPDSDEPAVAKLYYYDEGVFFLFDSNFRVCEFGVMPKREGVGSQVSGSQGR
ncbi:MAG: hypothetical protein HY763_01555 [Planctomycetes bacterium]|nr:hypothetical protein [Planctomycetota bacterium]